MKEFEIQDGVLVKYNGMDPQVVIPAGVREIGQYAFASRHGLREVLFQENNASETPVLTKIGFCAFCDCINLRSIELPRALCEIDGSAFADCQILKSIRIPARLEIIQSDAFSGCVNLKQVLFEGPSALRRIERLAFSDCKKLKSINIPASFDYIGSKVFSGCKSLKTLTFEEPQIPQKSLDDFSYLEGERKHEIHFWTFEDCPTLKTVIAPAHLKAAIRSSIPAVKIIIKQH